MIHTVQHSSPSANVASSPSSSSSKLACVSLPNRNATSASALPGNRDDTPHCIHGPSIKFERGGIVFYACSVERDNKSGGECGFRHNVAKDGEMTDAKVEKWKARGGIKFIFKCTLISCLGIRWEDFLNHKRPQSFRK